MVLFDGSDRIGRKILVSGGGRCNVTNVEVDEHDYVGGAPNTVRSILREFPVESVQRFFAERGLPLVEEPIGKLFPVSQSARDVLRVLLADVERAGITWYAGMEVAAVEPTPGSARRWRTRCADGRSLASDVVIVATGGKSVPKTGSKGFGYELAARLQLELVPPRPALVPLFLRREAPWADLSGITCAAILTVTEPGVTPEQISGARHRSRARSGGSLLFTHTGVSGPCALDVSEACSEAALQGRPVSLRGDFWTLTRADAPFPSLREEGRAPGSALPPRRCPRPLDRESFARDLEIELRRGDRSVVALLGERQPRRLAEALLQLGEIDARRPLSVLRGRELERLWAAVVHAQLPLSGTDDFRKAEVTAGGVPLESLHRHTLESRQFPGLRWCGEVLDATGRLGGFNFQWAWSSGFVAGGGKLRRHAPQ